jgi:NTE family protein
LIVDPLRRFCRMQIDTMAVGEGLLTPWKTTSDAVEARYRDELFDISLDQVTDSPCFVFNATNLQTGRSFRFSKNYMGDYRIGLIRSPTTPPEHPNRALSSVLTPPNRDRTAPRSGKRGC